MAKIGTILGSASIIVMDNTVDIAWVASKVIKFFKHESCGKCTPCREGTYWLDKVLDRIMAGNARLEDINLVDNIAKNMAGMTLCALGDFAANPVIHTIKNFRADFEAHVNSASAVETAAPAPAARGRSARAQATAGD
jgi:NADH-quinone oxidoreductase subunit F